MQLARAAVSALECAWEKSSSSRLEPLKNALPPEVRHAERRLCTRGRRRGMRNSEGVRNWNSWIPRSSAGLQTVFARVEQHKRRAHFTWLYEGQSEVSHWSPRASLGPGKRETATYCGGSAACEACRCSCWKTCGMSALVSRENLVLFCRAPRIEGGERNVLGVRFRDKLLNVRLLEDVRVALLLAVRQIRSAVNIRTCR